MTDLKPCPFCGSATGPTIWDCVSSDFSTGKSFWIYCGGCGVTTPHWPSTDELVKRWNTRATEDRLANDLGEAVALITSRLSRDTEMCRNEQRAFLARIAQEKKP